MRWLRVTESPHAALEALYAELHAVYPSGGSLWLKDSHRRATHLAHGWYMRVLRTSASVMLMREYGFCAESWPLRRAALEHVIALRWLAEKGEDAIDVVVRAHGESSRRRQESLRAADWGAADWDVWEAVIEGAKTHTGNVSESHILTNMKARVEKYGHPSDMASWLIETHHSHPGWVTAQPYFDQANTELRTVPTFDEGRSDAAFGSSNLLRGLAALNSMMEEPQWTERLVAWGDRFQRLQVDLPRAVEPRPGEPPR